MLVTIIHYQLVVNPTNIRGTGAAGPTPALVCPVTRSLQYSQLGIGLLVIDITV